MLALVILSYVTCLVVMPSLLVRGASIWRRLPGVALVTLSERYGIRETGVALVVAMTLSCGMDYGRFPVAWSAAVAVAGLAWLAICWRVSADRDAISFAMLACPVICVIGWARLALGRAAERRAA